jgi:small-conductance mechanosensitive channel
MLKETLFNLGPYKICLLNILILFLIFLIAVAMRRILHRRLKQYFKNANITIDGRLSNWLKLISQSVYLIAVYIAILSFNVNNENVTFGDFLNFKIIESEYLVLSFYHILVIIAIFFGAKMALNLTKIYISRKLRRQSEYTAGTEFVYIQLAKYVIYIFAIMFSLRAINVDLTLLLTGSAALLVGIGLGLQDVFKDIFSGIVLLFEGNIRVGDIVEISNGGKTENIVAKILKINVRTTQIETRDGNVLIIPNAKLTQEFIENWSHGSNLTRFKINLTVEYGSNVELIKSLMAKAALAHPKVRMHEEINVRLANFGNNGLELELIFWADHNWDINNYKSEIRFEIDRLFRENKITIPFPQSTVHISQTSI